jgi:hypothetical protein
MRKPISAGSMLAGAVLFVGGVAVGSGGSAWATHPRVSTVTRPTAAAVAEVDDSMKRGKLRAATPTPVPVAAVAHRAVRVAGQKAVVTPAPTPEATATPSSTPSATPSPTPSATPSPSPSATPAPPAAVPQTTAAVAYAQALVPVAATVAGQKAVAWADAELHSARPSWSDELHSPWSGYCEAFVEIAYGTRHHYVSALTDYRTQKGAGRIHTDDEPPAGALVYYGGGSVGHVALSVGGGQVVTTWGYAGQHYAVRQVGVRAFSNPYYGWSDAPASWPGR